MQIQKRRASHHERLGGARCQSFAVVEEAPVAEASQARPPPKIASNVTELIGNTPMVYLNKVRIVMLCRNYFSTQFLQFSWWTTGGPRIITSAGLLCLCVSVPLCTLQQNLKVHSAGCPGREGPHCCKAGDAGAMPQREGQDRPQHDRGRRVEGPHQARSDIRCTTRMLHSHVLSQWC
jgi:hypothetical protein